MNDTLRVWELEGWDEYDDVPDRRTGLAFLQRYGSQLSVPCSRYGHSSAECSLVAWRVSYLMARESGEPITFAGLDHAMGLVVNDHDDVDYLVRQYGRSDYGRAIR